MTVVSAKTLSRDDLKFLGSNVERDVRIDRRKCRTIHYIPAKAAEGIRCQGNTRHRCDAFIAAEVQ